MFSANKNSYLHSITTVNPRIINRCVDKAREFPAIDQFDESPGFNRLVSAQPCIPIPNCDVTTRPLAFGRFAMRKLRRELHDKDVSVVIQALNSLADLVHDPERTFEAIKLRIPDRLQDLILNKDHPAIRERALIILLTISNLLDGKMQIIRNKRLLESIFKAIDDDEIIVQCKALLLLEEIGNTWMTATLLIEANLLELLIQKLRLDIDNNESYLELLLRVIKNLIYCEGKQIALENGLFEILVHILMVTNIPPVVKKCLKILGILMETSEGKDLAIKLEVLKLLHNFLKFENVDIYQNAACAMVFATIKTEAILEAIILPGLCERLLFLILHAHEVTTQKYCMQVLTNLSAHRDIRLGFLQDNFKELEKIKFKDDEAGDRIRYNLLYNELR